MKETIWTILVGIYGILPAGLRKLLCRLSFAAAERRAPEAGLRELIEMHEQSLFHLDQIAIRYGGGTHPKHRLTGYHDFFTDHISSGETVLDVGCGVGAVAYSMVQAGARVTGVDFDETHLAIARDLFSHENLTFIGGDVTKVLPDGKFDAVVMSNVLEHIDDRVGVLQSLQKKFTPSRILIRVPMVTRDWLVPLRKELGFPHYCDPTHFTEYTTESFEKEMTAAGLSVKSIKVIWGEIWAEVSAGAESHGSNAGT